MAYTAQQLLAMPEKELDDLFSASPAGDIPNGEAEGTAIVASDTPFSSEIASIVNIFNWQGKTFDAAHGTLTNRILAFGVNAIVAEVYKGASLFDGKECIVLDYSKTSLAGQAYSRRDSPDWAWDVPGACVLGHEEDDSLCAAISRCMK